MALPNVGQCPLYEFYRLLRLIYVIMLFQIMRGLLLLVVFVTGGAAILGYFILTDSLIRI